MGLIPIKGQSPTSRSGMIRGGFFLVSVLISAKAAPGRIVDLLRAGKITLVLDDRILAEYHEVLTRPQFAPYFINAWLTRHEPWSVELREDPLRYNYGKIHTTAEDLRDAANEDRLQP
jgi:hypothetical protein